MISLYQRWSQVFSVSKPLSSVLPVPDKCRSHFLFPQPNCRRLSLCALLGIQFELDQLSCSTYYYYLLLKQEYKCCLFAVLTYVHCSVGFKYTFFAVKIISVAINFCGKNWRPQLCTYQGQNSFRRCNLWHTTDWIWKKVSTFPFGCIIFGME